MTKKDLVDLEALVFFHFSELSFVDLGINYIVIQN